MDWLTLLPWLGWVLTAMTWAALATRHRSVNVETPPSDAYRCVLQNSHGQQESVRHLKTGCAPIRIERGHGHRGSDWYRLVAVNGPSLIYRPEPPLT